MRSNDSYLFQSKLFNVDNNSNILFNIFGNPYVNMEDFLKNFYVKEKEPGIIYPLNDLLINLSQSILVPAPILPLNEIEKGKEAKISALNFNSSNSNKKKYVFKVNYPDKTSLFTNTENPPILEVKDSDISFLKRKKRMPRKYNKDNIRKKIKREFLNNVLIKKLNQKLKSFGSNLYFLRFPQSFVGDILIRTNREILNMKLREIFEKKEIINPMNGIDLMNYEHNLKVVKSGDITENEEFQKILNMTYCELFEEYLNSDEFKIDVVIQLKQKKMTDDYIKKYIYLSKHFIEFFRE